MKVLLDHLQVRAKTSIGYGANSSALTVTLTDAQTGMT